MPTQADFITPKRKSRPCIKPHAASTPTTFSAITQNLQKAFGKKSDSPTQSPISVKSSFLMTSLPKKEENC
jgi:hypothetical protein